MAFKLTAVFCLLVILQVCLTARVPREIAATGAKDTKDAKGAKVETVKSDVSDSSEESSEDFNTMAAKIAEMLSDKDKAEFNKIITDFNKTKTLEESTNRVVKLIDFVIKVAGNHTDFMKTHPIKDVSANDNAI